MRDTVALFSVVFFGMVAIVFATSPTVGTRIASRVSELTGISELVLIVAIPIAAAALAFMGAAALLARLFEMISGGGDDY